jgi:large subunit ribosomal protein L21
MGTARSPPLVQSLAVPKPDSSLSAVIVSGGKQYRVAPGDHILVDRLAAEPGSSLKLDRVLLLRNGDEIRIGSPAVDGLDVEVKVLAHRRGPRIESIRYKSKKRVRVHHGGRADLTALEIIAVGGMTGEAKSEAKTEIKPKAKSEAKTRVKAESKKAATSKAEVVETPDEEKTEAAKPAKRATRKKETE